MTGRNLGDEAARTLARYGATPRPYTQPHASEVGDAIRQLWQENPHLDESRMAGLALQVDDLWRRAQEHRHCEKVPPPTERDKEPFSCTPAEFLGNAERAIQHAHSGAIPGIAAVVNWYAPHLLKMLKEKS